MSKDGRLLHRLRGTDEEVDQELLWLEAQVQERATARREQQWPALVERIGQLLPPSRLGSPRVKMLQRRPRPNETQCDVHRVHVDRFREGDRDARMVFQ